MNKVDIIRKHIGNDHFYDMNGTSMLTNILNAMEDYKEQEVKNCSIPNVTNCDCENSKAIETAKGIICYECERPK
jgi:hypothetical protein